MNKMQNVKQVIRKVNHQFVNIEAATKSQEVVSFSFGSNWKRYLKGFTEERVDTAMQSIREFSGLETLSGQTFLDFGCGSGLFSLAAYRLDAAQVISIDIDPHSIDCVRSLWAKQERPPNWRILQGSALDRPFIERLGHASFVYSWGVLHHTGAMYDAIRNVASIVGPQGYFYVAIYNRNKHAAKWLKVKRIYNRLPFLLKQVVVGLYAIFNIVMNLRAGNNPFKVIHEYKSNRGMSWLSDIRDWLGGLPYEFATVEEIKGFIHELGFEMKRVRPNGSHGCNEFLLVCQQRQQ